VMRFRFRRRTTTMAGLRPVQPRPESVARTTRTFTSRWPEADAPTAAGVCGCCTFAAMEGGPPVGCPRP